MAILVVEDEIRVRSFIERGLTEEGYTVRVAADGEAAEREFSAGGIEVVLLDWMLPGTSGLDLLLRWRAREDVTPVVMITARDSVDDRVAALNAGADDYLIKPFAFDELVARVRAVLRRAAPAEAPAEQIRRGDLVVDSARHEVTCGGSPVDVTPTEFRILRFLAARPGRVFSREEILDGALEGAVVVERTVDVHLASLRRKLGRHGDRIETVRGVGYRFREEEEAGPGGTAPPRGGTTG
jgi:two-component system phosphate regulon response regulator PhoB